MCLERSTEGAICVQSVVVKSVARLEMVPNLQDASLLIDIGQCC